MSRYGWRKHDGLSFGEHEVVDPVNGVILNSSFVKYPGGENGESS